MSDAAPGRDAGSRMYVFRAARRLERGRDMVCALSADVTRAARAPERAAHRSEEIVHALVRAGETEAAFADAAVDDPRLADAAERSARITDALCEALLTPEWPSRGLPDVEATLSAMPVPERVRVSPHEGFAYYALHPLTFGEVVRALPQTSTSLVVGIRSIGATLSAMVAARLRAGGTEATRLTVRPGGHPYARSLVLDRAARDRVQRHNEKGAAFLVADEGPGLSGSSLLAVGEALVACGVPSDRVTFLCSRFVDPATLLAPDAAARWSVFRAVACPSAARLPCEVGEPLAGDHWRRRAFGSEPMWPASWTQFERVKFLTPDGVRLLKFEGLGPYGAEALRRGAALHAEGWGPEPKGEGAGFVSYALATSPMRRAHRSEAVLARIARYCAARTRIFPVAHADTGDLLEMLRTNVREEFGRDVPAAWIPRVERPVIADARMQPHEWVRGPGGTLLKVDGVSHGDDHFFPGWTDIAWDLAGAIVEWGLDRCERQWLLRAYRRASGDDPSARISPYIRAYAVFRMAYSKMAAAAVGPGAESDRLLRDYRRYRALVCPCVLR